MLKKLKTSTKLTLLVSVLAFFILGVGIYGIRAMKKMNQNIQTIYADRVLAIQQLTNIRYSYATGILAMAEQLENHQVEAGVAKDKIEVSEKIINDNWQAYLKTYLTPEETELIRQTDPLKAEADKATAALKQKIQKEGTSLSGDIIDEEMYAAINPVITKLNELIRVQIKVSSELNKTNAQLYHSTLEKFYILIIASLLLAIILAFFIIDDTRKIINELNSSNKKIKEAEEKCKAYIRYAGDAIFILDQDLLITDANNSACNLLATQRKKC